MEDDDENLSEAKSPLMIVIWVITVVGLIAFAIYENSKYQVARKSKHYTIGKIYNIATSSDAGWFVSYKYTVKNINYQSPDPMPVKTGGEWIYNPKVGERYYVKFLEDDPYYAVICLDRQVPDSIKEAPREGWVGDLPCSDN